MVRVDDSTSLSELDEAIAHASASARRATSDLGNADAPVRALTAVVDALLDARLAFMTPKNPAIAGVPDPGAPPLSPRYRAEMSEPSAPEPLGHR